MLHYEFLYSDGQVLRRSFLDEGEALWFALNEVEAGKFIEDIAKKRIAKEKGPGRLCDLECESTY